MFRMECFVEDKHVADVLRAVAGMVHNLQIVPVVEPSTVNGSDRTADLFADYLNKHEGQITVQYAREFQKSIGRSPSSAQYVLSEAVRHKIIRRVGAGRGAKYHRISSNNP